MGGLDIAVSALHVLPKNAISRVMGRLAEIPLPRPLRRILLSAFGRAVGVDFDEVRDPLSSFVSLQTFFTRALREGVRPIDPDPSAFVSPCDATWGASGSVEAGRILQIKGRPYSLAALLGDAEAAARFEGGSYATFYLSPRDYHRFHVPCDVHVSRIDYLPGTLWPVNRIGVEGVEGLFAENERICAHMVIAGRDEAELCLVAVGATMVGRIRLTFDETTTNRAGAERHRRCFPPGEVALARGEEWGHFEFGSTIVLLARRDAVDLALEPPGTIARLGRAIGRLKGSAVR